MGEIHEVHVMEDGHFDHLVPCESKDQAVRVAHTLSLINQYRSCQVWRIPVVGDAVKIAEFKSGKNLMEFKPKE